MGLTADAPALWPIPADWSNPILERLGWLTGYERSQDMTPQKRAVRQYPLRQFEFDVLAGPGEQDYVDNLLADRGARTWWLPIWPDLQVLYDGLASASDSIPCATEFYDFEVGGHVALVRDGSPAYEIAEISAVETEGLELVAPTALVWAPGTRLYPVRSAVLTDHASNLSLRSDNVVRMRMQFTLDEPSAWPGALPDTLYRGVPVLEDRPDWSSLPDAGHERAIDELRAPQGGWHQVDVADRNFYSATHAWCCFGRSEYGALRTLLHGLRGRQKDVWRPTWREDFRLASAAASDATQIVVRWSGYSVLGLGRMNRQDIRIELANGTVLRRRILDAEVTGGGSTETLTLDAALGVAITPAAIARISYLVLCDQATDAVELQYITDPAGVVRAETTFRGARHEF